MVPGEYPDLAVHCCWLAACWQALNSSSIVADKHGQPAVSTALGTQQLLPHTRTPKHPCTAQHAAIRGVPELHKTVCSLSPAIPHLLLRYSCCPALGQGWCPKPPQLQAPSTQSCPLPHLQEPFWGLFHCSPGLECQLPTAHWQPGNHT